MMRLEVDLSVTREQRSLRACLSGQGTELAGRLWTAHSLFTRMKGLLGKHSLREGEGLWIRPCNAVHTFGMRFPIDVVFLDRDCRVVALYQNLQPNRITPLSLRTSSVLELPAGKIAQAAVTVGDEIGIG